MPAPIFDASRIGALLGRLVEEVDGDWLLIGGALVAVWLNDRRSTEDLDLVGMEALPDARYKLLQFASDHGLPVESVNSAADFFVRSIVDWKHQVEPLLRGSRGTLYRPSATLFLLLKARRLSEQDLEDCRLLLDRCRSDRMDLDRERILREMERLDSGTDGIVRGRRATLAAWLRELPKRP